MSTDQTTAVHFHAGSNDPGYLPDSEPASFPTWEDVQRYMIDELLLDADNAATWNEPHECDDVPCPTFGDECPEGKASDLTNVAEDLNLSNGPDWSTITAGRSYWIVPCSEPNCETNDYEEEPKTERTAWQLALLADCADPQSADSVGALWLVRLAGDAEELRSEEGDDLTDGIALRADASVPIYTHEVWATFVDLGAYQEDISDLIGAETDMEKMAQVALYMIAERLLSALLSDAA